MIAFSSIINQCVFNENAFFDTEDIQSEFLRNAVNIIEKNLNQSSFGFDEFASNMNVSKSTLHRRIFAATGFSPLGLIRDLRIKYATVLLKNDRYYISEIAYHIGFNDPKYFCRCFKAQIGMNPKEYRDYLKAIVPELKLLSEENSDQFLQKTISTIERNISDSTLSARILANELNVSKTTLYRRLKSYSGLSPCEFINSVRIDFSVKLLKNRDKQICDIAFASGFNNPKYFSRRFKAEFGVSPSEYNLQSAL